MPRRFVKNRSRNVRFKNVENGNVPSVMVLVLGNDTSLSSVADAAVAGAKSVRFTEVTVRAMELDVFRYRLFDAGAER